jgi:phosphate-selective porin OprO/OprP
VVVTDATRPTLYPFNDTVLLRRVEPTFELQLGKLVFFRLQPQFSGDTASTADVYGELRFLPEFYVRGGKFKGPVSLDNLRSTGAITFVERGFPTELAPNRDLGFQVGGDLFDARLSYAVSYSNGTPDGRDANGTSDPDNRKEVGARLFAEPFKNDPGVLQGLGFGVGGSSGPKKSLQTSVQTDFLPRYRTPGQNTFFSYIAPVAATATTPATIGVVADGTFSRIDPQAYWFYNGFSLLAEYIVSSEELARDTHEEKVKNKAWQVSTGYFLTGEDAAFKGLSKINQPFAIGKPGWGAFEVAARYGELDVDNDAFAGDAALRFADPTKVASKAKAWTAALNWYPTVNTKVAFNYTDTSFDGGAATGDLDRNNEKAFFTRFQINY